MRNENCDKIESVMDEIKCTGLNVSGEECNEIFQNYNLWIFHMKQHKSNEEFRCCYCFSSFPKIWRMNRHASLCTARENVLSDYEEMDWIQSSEHEDYEENVLQVDQFHEFLANASTVPPNSITLGYVEKNIYKFILGMYGKMSVPRKTASQTLAEVKDKIIFPLINLIIQNNPVSVFNESVLVSLTKFMRLHESEHNFKKVLKRKGFYFDPVYFKIHRPHNLRPGLQHSHGYVVPIAENIKTLFQENSKELIAMLKLHKELMSKDNGVIESEVQCEVWREKMGNFRGLEVIPIRIYQDDFEVNNALGSKSGCQKISGIYITFPLLGELIFIM